MSQRLTNSFVNTNIPGPYPHVEVKSNPVGVAASGIVIIMGEADGGDSFHNVALKDNSFTPDQYAKVQAAYVSGPIVDAMKALTAPSGDADITGSATRVYIVKTNSSVKASAIVDTDYGTMLDGNFGKNGNKYKFQITATAVESAPVKTGTVPPAFGAPLNGAEFGIRLNGGAMTTVLLSSTPANHADAATLATEINAQLPAGIVCTVSAGALVLTVGLDASANRRGYGKSLELSELHAGDLAALGLTAGLTVSAQEPAVEIAISRADIGLSETLDVSADIAMQVGYLGTTAMLNISKSAQTLTTTVTGGVGAALSLDMTQFRTVADLAAAIAAAPGYTASASAAAQQMQPSKLDTVVALSIATSTAGNKPGRVKNAAAKFQAVMATSRALAFLPTAQAGLPSVMAAPLFLTGGAKGSTSAADIAAAVDQMAVVNANIIVPLFSRDATADIADGLTDSASTYTIDAVHALVKSHCITYSTPKLKRNRIAILSSDATYAVSKAKGQSLAHYRVSLTIQKSTQANSAGAITVFPAWYTSAVAAGMQAGGFYKAIVNKAANLISFVDPVGFNSGSPGDVEDALDAGLLLLANDTTRNYWVSDQTTYGYDTNFVYNSIQAVYCSDLIALDLSDSFWKAFGGRSLADVSAASGLAFLAQKMDQYKKQRLIASSDDAPLGWKNGKVAISAPVMEVSVEIKLATAVYFIPLNISISQVQQTA